jgi:hypothetical protein
VTIKGSIIGNAQDSALISIDDGAGSIFVGGSIIGGDDRSAKLEFGGDFSGQEPVGMVKVVGSVLGGFGDFSGWISMSGEMKSLSVGGEWRGGAGQFSARFTGDKVGSVSVGGSLVGGAGAESGQFDLDAVGTVTIAGDFSGGAGQRSGFIKTDSIKTMSVGRSIFTGTGAGSGRLEVEGHLDSLTVGGSIRGSAANPMMLLLGGVSAPVKGADLVLGKLTVKGSVEYADILGGFATLGGTTVTARNADAQIGSVMVAGDWIASSISAGVQEDASSILGTFFGNADDRKIQGAGTTDTTEIVSKIGSITIKGHALGTTAAGDHFGFVAQEIGALSIGPVKYPLTSNAATDDLTATDPLFLIGATNDFRVHEVAL